MNDSHDQLEKELRQIRPAPVPPRLQRQLDGVGERSASWLPVRWPVVAVAAASLAAVIALSIAVRPSTTPPDESVAVLGPVKPHENVVVAGVDDCPPEVLRVLCGERDEGIVMINQTVPYRQVRRLYVALYTWDQCLDGARLDYTVPTEEVALVPVAVY